MIYEVQNNDDFSVDNDAKDKIDLFKKLDSNGEAYYIGKIQANYLMDLNAGQSFMVFLSDEQSEQLQVGPLDPLKRKFAHPPTVSGDRITIPLKKHIDAHNEPYYVGELVQLGTHINMSKGLFFTIFTSREGQEQIQITPLKKRKNREFRTSAY